MAKHNITLNLTDDQEEFITKLREYDRKNRLIRYTANEEIQLLATMAIRETKDFFEREGFFK